VWRGSLTSFSVNSVGIIGVPLVVATVGGVPAAGGLRAAQAVAGLPLQVPQGLQIIALAKSQRDFLSDKDGTSVVRAWIAFHSLLFVLMVPVALAIPDSWGTRAFGDVWRLASGALPLLLLASGAAACTLGIELYARVIGRTNALAGIRAIAIAPTLAFAAAGAAVLAAVGAAIGLLIGQCLLLSLALAWFLKGTSRGVQHSKGHLDEFEE
jgi:hypothetical protein